MVSRASRKSRNIYRKWNKASLLAALNSIQKDGMSLNKAAKLHGVPKTSLMRHLRNKSFIDNDLPKLGRKFDLPEELENQLVEHVLEVEAEFYDMLSISLRKLAYEIAEMNNIKTRFNSETKMAGKEWLQGFLQRHREISLRTVETTSLCRQSAFDKTKHNFGFQFIAESLPSEAIKEEILVSDQIDTIRSAPLNNTETNIQEDEVINCNCGLMQVTEKGTTGSDLDKSTIHCELIADEENVGSTHTSPSFCNASVSQGRSWYFVKKDGALPTAKPRASSRRTKSIRATGTVLTSSPYSKFVKKSQHNTAT